MDDEPPRSTEVASEYRRLLNQSSHTARPSSAENLPRDDGKPVLVQPAEPASAANKAGSIIKLQHLVDVADPDQLGSFMTVALDRYNPRQARKALKEKHWLEAVIVVRRVIEAGIITSFTVEINSASLQAELRRLVNMEPFRDVRTVDETMIIPNPFRCLFHNCDKIKQAIKSTSSVKASSLKDELTLLHDFIISKEALEDTIREHESLTSQKIITFDLLWTIYPPQELVLQLEDGAAECYRVEDAWEDADRFNRLILKVSLLSMRYDGRRGGICRTSAIIPWFNGTVRISPQELPLFPLRYVTAESQKEIKRFLIERGKQYVHLQSQRYNYLKASYFWGDVKEDGLAIQTDPAHAATQSNFRVVVDAAAARDAGKAPNITLISSNWDEYTRGGFKGDLTGSGNGVDGPSNAGGASGQRNDTEAVNFDSTQRMDPVLNIPLRRKREKEQDTQSLDTREPPWRQTRDAMQSPGDRVLEANSSNNWSYKEPNFTDDDYVLAPMRLPAFLLDKRQWIEAAVTGLKGIDFYPHPFNTLQLNPDKKKLIKALVKGFNTTGRKRFKGFDDIVQGKGRGLFFLLHGDSGLGKTFTAEAIAEETKRPLYHVSTGELGTGVKEMEMNLTEVFKLGWRWGAVVLIDEADVLVAKRTDNELERNAVVAMFLNLVEYYQGLLFVTTNREFSFDDAFENRMHAILKFPKLDFQARLNIWRNLIVNRLNPVPLDDSWSEDQEELEILAKLELNGRDIRNLIRTACAFASSYKKNLGVRHIAMVLREVCKASNLKEIIDELAPALKRVVTLPVEGGQRPFDTIDNEAEDANESEDDGEHDDDQSKPLGLIGGLPVEW